MHIRIATFEEWVRLNPNAVPISETVDCPTCDGFGDVECSECGHEKDCETCGGYGEVDLKSLSQQERKLFETEILKAAYEDQKQRDLKRITEYEKRAQS